MYSHPRINTYFMLLHQHNMEMLSGERFSGFLKMTNPKCSTTRLAFQKIPFQVFTCI